MTHRDIITRRAAAFGNNHFAVTHRENRCPLRHGEIDTLMRRNAARYRVQATRVKVGGDAELFRCRETHKAFRQPGTVAVVKFTVVGANRKIILSVRAQTNAQQLALFLFPFQHFAGHQYRELVPFFQLTEIHLPLHRFNDRTDFHIG